MRLVSCKSYHTLHLCLSALLLILALHSHTVLSQTFTFDLVTSTLPWSPRTNYPSILAPLSTESILFFGGANGQTNNDIWLSTDSAVTWSLQSGTSITGSAPGLAANQSFPATAYALLAFDSASGYSFQYGGYTTYSDNNTNTPSTDTYYSTTGTNWQQSANAVGSSAPTFRAIPGTIVTTSNTAQDGSFLLIGGLDSAQYPNYTESAVVWKSSPLPNRWDLRQWSVVGSTVDASYSRSNSSGGLLSVYSPVLMDQGRLDGRDILYMLGGVDYATNNRSDAVWASSDEGATWVQLAASSFGVRLYAAAAVSDEGVMFVLGGLIVANNSLTSLSDMWASFDGGYSWSLCSDALPPRDTATMVYNSNTQQLMYGLGYSRGFNRSLPGGGFLRMNDLYTADVTDVYAVATMCGATVPAAGPGLTRWPATAGSSSTGAAAASSSSGGSTNPTRGPSSSTPPPTIGPPPTVAPSTAGPSSTPIIPTTAFSSTNNFRTSSSSPSSSSSTGTTVDNDDSSSSNGVLIAFLILFAVLSTACAVLAYTQYRLRVHGTVCCEECAGVSCGQLCGETVGWGTKWQRRSNLSDADLLRQVATDRYD